VGHRRRLIVRAVAVAALTCGLLAATPASVPSDLSQIELGHSAKPLTFAPIGGAAAPMIVPGKPTVVIAFASWCPACVAEMPRNVQDYERFKDRVTFLGIDYVDSRPGGDGMIAKFGIPFPVERLGLAAQDAAPAGAAAIVSREPIQLHGVTPKTLASILPAIQSQMPGVYPILVDIAARCASLSETNCLDYAHSSGVDLDASGHVVAPPSSGAATVSLPATFVIDAGGVVVQHFEGYDPASDAIASALGKLGIR
jgi:thiol-disulfide isomerase/thioredoxin